MKKQTIEEIASHYQTDKQSSDHNYTEYYEQYFEAIRDKELNVVEIGILRHPARPYEGASLLLWRDYFANSIIHGIDINDHRSMEQQRIKIHIADQGKYGDKADLIKTSIKYLNDMLIESTIDVVK